MLVIYINLIKKDLANCKKTFTQVEAELVKEGLVMSKLVLFEAEIFNNPRSGC